MEKSHDLADRQRPGEQVTLEFLATKGVQHRQLALLFDALGDDMQVQAVRQRHD